jgi:hypothetical protein
MQNEKLPAETVPAPLNPAPQIRAAPAARKRQTSERRTAASRANGAKSHGPKTHAGKARSSANSLTHGIYSRGCLIPGECQVTFDRMLSDYMARLQPRDQVEENLVNIMVHSCWRTSRIWHLEKEVMAAAHDQLLQNHDFNNNDAGALSHSARAARAFHDLADQSKVLPLIARFEGSYERTYSRALRDLLKLRAMTENAKTNPTSETKQ